MNNLATAIDGMAAARDGLMKLTAIDNPMASGLGRHLDRQERRDDATERAYVQLRDELIDALLKDPAKVVAVPGWKQRDVPAAEVINDSFAGSSGDASLHELLRIVGMCAQGVSGPEVHLRASAWIAARAKEHAEMHQDDLVEEWEA